MADRGGMTDAQIAEVFRNDMRMMMRMDEDEDFGEMMKKTEVEYLMKEMKKTLAKPEEQISCCSSILKLLDSVQLLLNGGVLSRLSEAMKKHLNNQKVQESIIMAYGGILECVNRTQLASLIQKNFDTMLITLMNKHPTSKVIQSTGMAKLLLFAKVDGLALGKKNLLVEVVLRAMNQYLADGQLQASALELLANIMPLAEVKSKICSQKGAKVVLDAMEKHPRNIAVQTYSCRFISNLGSVQDAFTTEMNTQSRVLHAIRQCPGSDQVLSTGIDALVCLYQKTLSENSTSFEEVVLPAIVQGMRWYRGSEVAQASAFRAFAGIVKSSPDKLGTLLGLGLVEEDVLNTMERFESSAGIQESGCVLIQAACERGANCGTLLKQGSVERILSAMQKHPQNEGVQRSAVSALVKLIHTANAQDENFKRKCIDLGAGNYLFLAMLRFKANKQILTDCCFAVNGLVPSQAFVLEKDDEILQEKYSRFLGKAAEMLVKLVQDQKSSKAILYFASKALASIVTVKGNIGETDSKLALSAITSCSHFLQAEDVSYGEGETLEVLQTLSDLFNCMETSYVVSDETISVLKKSGESYHSSLDVQRLVKNILESLAAKKIRPHDISFKCEDKTSFLQTMQGYSDDPRVQQRACRELSTLLANGNFKTADLAEAIDSVLEAMKRHHANESLQADGVVALSAILDSDKSTNDERIESVTRLVLLAMQQHKESARVQEFGCVALAKITNWSQRGKEILSEVLKQIKDSMRFHQSCSSVQTHACGAFARLAVNPEVKSLLEQHQDLVSLLLQAMNSHLNIADVQKSACGALWNFASLKENAVMLVKCGAGEAVLRAMKKHREHAEVQHRACGTLWNFGKGGAEVKVKLSNSVFDIISALKLHIMNARVQVQALGALSKFLSGDEHEEILTGSSGSVVLVTTQSMNLHPSNAEIQEHGCAILAVIAEAIARSKRCLVRLGTAAIVAKCVARFPDKKRIQLYGRRTLSLLELKIIDEALC